MNRMIGRRLALLVVVFGVVFAVGALSACDDDTPPPVKPDHGTTDTNQQDTFWPDTTQADQYVWPDVGGDKKIWPDHSYTSPFGCKSDSDCFGQKCCPTPWGVKLCAPTCK